MVGGSLALLLLQMEGFPLRALFVRFWRMNMLASLLCLHLDTRHCV